MIIQVATVLVVLSFVLHRRIHFSGQLTGAQPMNSDRYKRQVGVWGESEQASLRKFSVLVVGMGGLGSAVVPLLAGAGIGRLGLADFDRVSLDNLHRQTIHTQKAAEVGELKVDSAAKFVRRLNPDDVELETISEPVDSMRKALRWVARYDLVVDATDDVFTRLVLNRACVELKKPIVYGVVQHLAGYVAVFWPSVKPEFGCFACAFPKDYSRRSASTPPPVAGPAPAIIGALQANEALKLARDSFSSISGFLIAVDLSGPMDRDSVAFVKLRPRGSCDVCGASLNR